MLRFYQPRGAEFPVESQHQPAAVNVHNHTDSANPFDTVRWPGWRERVVEALRRRAPRG